MPKKILYNTEVDVDSFFRVEDVSVISKRGSATKLILDNISFEVNAGQFLGIVGESGAGKSTLLRIISGMPHNTALQIIDGGLFMKEEKILLKTRGYERKIRKCKIALVPQFTQDTLNPSRKIGDQIGDIIKKNNKGKVDIDKIKNNVLIRCGIHEVSECLIKYPHQLSGGMIQRVLIAMALLTKPDFLIADEATSALDATIGHEIMLLLRQLQKENNLGIFL